METIHELLRKMAANFDENLKDKHFKNKATSQILEATGNFVERAGLKYLQVIEMYTIYHKPLASYLNESVLEETKEPLTPLPNKEKPSGKRLYEDH